uniref:Uncharacterized protein n=1 Tax=Nelumbo nucifera TaxID=4432 RepID=A0A822XWI5_NELNU|nr:TPA_asm: hypothetical protein HUJ06_023221 [Nelumbo nucifera]
MPVLGGQIIFFFNGSSEGNCGLAWGWKGISRFGRQIFSDTLVGGLLWMMPLKLKFGSS